MKEYHDALALAEAHADPETSGYGCVPTDAPNLFASFVAMLLAVCGVAFVCWKVDRMIRR